MTPTPKPILLSARHRRTILWSLLITAGAYLLVVLYTGHKEVSQAFTTIGLTGWIFLFTCSLLNYFLRYLRWQYYLRCAGWSLPHNTHFLYYLAGFALTTTPGKAGELIRSVLLRPHGVPYPVSLACFFTERFLDVIIIGVLASLTVTAFDDYRHFVLLTTLLILMCLPLIHARWPHHRLHHLVQHSLKLLQSAQQFLSWRLIVFGSGLGLVAWSIQGLAFFYIVHTLGFDVGILAAMGIYAVSLLAGAVSFIPGGVGTTEVVMGLLIAMLGAEPVVAVAAPLISRLSTLWFAVVLGLLSSSWLTFSKPRSTSSTSS